MIVVDCSVAAKWIFPEEGSERALALFDNHIARGERVVAPHLLPIEFTNVIRQRMRREDLAPLEAEAALERFVALPIEFRPRSSDGQGSLHRRALLAASRYDLPATYDAYYLALAEMLACDFWTADERLLRRVGHRMPSVRALATYNAAP